MAGLDRAHQLLAGATEKPTGSDFFDHPRFVGLAGATYLCMSETARAVPLLVEARERRARTDVKGQALLTLDLAYCRAVSREPEEAAQLALDAVMRIAGAEVQPVVARLRAVSRALSPWASLPAVRELSDRARELSHG